MLLRIFIVAWAFASGMPAMAQDRIFVNYAEVRQQLLTFDTTFAGTIEARDSVNIGFRQGGRIVEVMVKEGDHVDKGAALARIDPLQQNQALNVAQARLASATATADQSRLARDRAEAMLQAGVGTRAALDNAQQALSAAEGSLAQAQTELDQAKRAVDDTVLLAPSDAIVTMRDLEVGQIIGVGQAVFSLASDQGLEAVFQTPDLPILDRAIGVPVTLRGIDVEMPEMTAIVREVSPLVDPHTGSVTVRARIESAPAEVTFLGAAVRGTVHFPVGMGISIPWTALSASGNSAAVWQIQDDLTVTITPIRIEHFTTDAVVIASGLAPGDRVVTSGSQLVYPGRQVTLVGAPQ